VVPVDGKYTAQPNDNFYTISQKVYGSGAYFEALAKFNKDKYPKANQIRIGDVVQAPPVETLEGRYPELCPKPEHRDAAKKRSTARSNQSLAGRRVYVVQEGDNLFDIARFELGARAKVADLIELNRDVLGDHINYLTPGMRLVLPETDDRDSNVAQGPTNTQR
jgi:nucleoid-associated protein YgaU